MTDTKRLTTAYNHTLQAMTEARSASNVIAEMLWDRNAKAEPDQKPVTDYNINCRCPSSSIQGVHVFPSYGDEEKRYAEQASVVPGSLENLASEMLRRTKERDGAYEELKRMGSHLQEERKRADNWEQVSKDFRKEIDDKEKQIAQLKLQLNSTFGKMAHTAAGEALKPWSPAPTQQDNPPWTMEDNVKPPHIVGIDLDNPDEEQIKKLINSHNKLSEELAFVRGELNKSLDELNFTNSQLGAVNKQLNKVIEDRDAWKENHRLSREVNSRLVPDINRLTSERDAARRERDAIRRERETALRDHEELKKSYNNFYHSHQELAGAYEQLKVIHCEVIKRVDNARNQLDLP